MKLTEKEKYVLEAREQGKTFPEIAEQLGICMTNVKAKYDSALQKRQLNERYPEISALSSNVGRRLLQEGLTDIGLIKQKMLSGTFEAPRGIGRKGVREIAELCGIDCDIKVVTSRYIEGPNWLHSKPVIKCKYTYIVIPKSTPKEVSR